MEFSNGPRVLAGVSLVELTATLAIIGILSAVAVPNLAYLHRSAARTTAVNDFMHSIFLARSRAISTNGVVSICRSSNGEKCDSRASNWETGWIVFDNLDRDQPADRDVGEPIVYRHGTWPTGRITSNRLSFSFRPTAQTDVNGTIVFCGQSGAKIEGRAIIISHTGRPRVSLQDASNKPLACD